MQQDNCFRNTCGFAAAGAKYSVRQVCQISVKNTSGNVDPERTKLPLKFNIQNSVFQTAQYILLALIERARERVKIHSG